MRFKFQYCLFLLLAYSTVVTAQLEADNWIFAGGGNYINFNKATQAASVPLPPFSAQMFGGTTYSDKNGQLLFYSDGAAVNNGLFQRFPSTSNTTPFTEILLGSVGFGGQKVLAIPFPGSASKYILFHIYYQLYTNYKSELLFSIIDMKADSGRGAVDSFQRNVPVLGPLFNGSNILFKLTAVQHCNKKDIWVVGHYANSDKYFSLLVTSNGITGLPVLSTGSFITSYNSQDSLWHPSLQGYIKISPLGNKIAASFKSPDYIELGDFNTQTGVVSNIKKLTASPPPSDTIYNPLYSYRIHYGVAGVEFSPSGDRLYASSNYYAKNPNGGPNNYFTAFIYQFNTALPTEAQIQSSKYFIDSIIIARAGAIQLANTGKLYINVWDNLCEVADPEGLGVACNYTAQKYRSFGGSVGLELPNILQSYLRYPMITTGNCQFQNIDFSIQNPIGVSSVLWDFGDPASGASNSSTSFTPTHIYSTQGYYEVKAILQNANGCGADTIRKVISAGPFKVFLGNDTTICQGDTLQLRMHIPSATNSWSNNSNDTIIKITQPGIYWVKVNLGDCFASDTINVFFNNLPQFTLGNDTVICNNSSVTLSPNPVYAGANYLWSTNVNTGNINANTAGQYWLQLTDNNGCKWQDTLSVSFKTLPNYNLGADKSICEKDTATLIATVTGATSYLWNTGEVTSIIKAFQNLVYWCDVNKEGCVYRDSILVTVKPLPIVNLGTDVTLCEDNTLLLDAANLNSTYLWQDNSTNPTYLIKKAGKYYVTVNRQNCIVKDTINIAYNLKPVFTLGSNQPICNGMVITLNPQLSNVSYLWQDGTIAPTYTVTQFGLYYLTATNTCGSKTDSILITRGFCKLYIPNAFTPNGDGKNDVFKASFGENITEYSLQIFNRYGEIVFENKDKNKGWDGTYRGARQPGGTFFWLINYKTTTDKNLQQLKGSVLIIR